MIKKYLLTLAALLLVPQIGFSAEEYRVGNIKPSEDLKQYPEQLDASKKILESKTLPYEEILQLYKDQFFIAPIATVETELATTEKQLEKMLKEDPESEKTERLKAKVEALKHLLGL